jgi:hypothetical protein
MQQQQQMMMQQQNEQNFPREQKYADVLKQQQEFQSSLQYNSDTAHHAQRYYSHLNQSPGQIPHLVSPSPNMQQLNVQQNHQSSEIVEQKYSHQLQEQQKQIQQQQQQQQNII